MSVGQPPPDPAAIAAAQAALRRFTIEAWTLLAVGVCVTTLRTYARVRAVGFRRLAADDYLAWLAMVVYAIETSLAYSVGHVAHGLANNGLTDAQRAAMSPDDPEYRLRVVGSKIQIAGWTSYSTLLWLLKASLLAFYIRLTEGLPYIYRIRILIGFAFLVVSYVTVAMNLYLSCQPFHKLWQISPDPGNVCQPAVSQQIIWVYLAFNVATDVYLLSIPLPMLWTTSLKPIKKFGLMVLFSGGVFVMVCATLRCILIVTDEKNGAQLAGSWAVRETFVAVVTTNVPMIFPLLKGSLLPLFGSIFMSMRSSHKLDEVTPKGLVTFGGSTQSWRGRGPPTAYPITNITRSESEERMVEDIKLQDLKKTPHKSARNSNIRKDTQIDVVCEDRPSLPQCGRLMSVDEESRRFQGSFPLPGTH